MDTHEYLPMFLAECREHLQELNLAVVALEQTPDDRDRIDEVFRIAHSLKGMSATMGFAQMAELTHSMEDVFELIRQRREGIKETAVDALLDCLDMLSAAVDAIDECGEERIDPAGLIERLHSLVRVRNDDQPPPDPPLVIPPGGHPEGLTVTTTLIDDVAMPSVRAYMVLTGLAEHGRIVVSQPAEDAVDEFNGRVIEVVLDTDHEDEALMRTVHGIDGVASVTVLSRRPHGEVPDAPDAAGVTVTTTLIEDVAMPSVRAYMVLAALAEHGRIVRSSPAEEAVDEFDGRVIEVVLDTDHEDKALEQAASSIDGVASVQVAAPAAPAPAPTGPAGAAPPEPPARVPGATADLGPESAIEPAGGPAPATAPVPSAAPATDAAAATAPARAGKPGAGKRGVSTVRVEADRLDQLMGVMGELVVHRTQLEALVAQADVPGIAQAMQELNRSSQALRAMVMQVRMIEVEAVFLRLPRLVRDLSSRLGKSVELRLTGADTELDRTVVDALGDPLVHLVRNAIDHGLESPEDRVAAGKPPTGVVEIGARHAGGSVVITVRDDGRGIDAEAVGRRAVERGLIAAGEPVDMARAIELLFAPGFSTAEEMSEISGRGVGMDAVRATVQSLGGEVTLQSVLGEGTTTQLRLPLTLAIMSALLVQVAGRPFAVPLDRVERTLRLEDQPVRSAAGRRLLLVPDGVLPLLEGETVLDDGTGETSRNDHAVIVRAGEQRVALAVEHLIGQFELVTRPLPPALAGGSAISGGAVLSDGGIALIVDCDALAGTAGRAAPSTLVPA